MSEQSVSNIQTNDDFSLKVSVDGQQIPITSQEYDLLSQCRKNKDSLQLLLGSDKTKFGALPIEERTATILPQPDFKKYVKTGGNHQEILIPSINSL